MADTNHHEPAPPGDGAGFGPLAQLLLWLGAISAAFVIFVIVAPISSWFPAATRQANEVDALFKFMLATSGVIFIYVQGLLLAFALRYRRQKNEGDDVIGSQMHGNTRLEIAWSAAPAALLVIIAVLSLGVWADEHNVQKNELQLDVKGFQFGWSFSLPQYGIKDSSTIVIPVNRPVYVSERSPDVIHSFWVPEFRMKQDVVPGIVTHERFTPTRIGTYRVICTEFCGSNHSGMVSKLTVGSEATFVAWLRAHGASSVPSGSTAALIKPIGKS